MEKIFMQLYSLEDGVERTLGERLELVEEMGYDGVELFGPFTEMPMEDLKAKLDQLKLSAVSMHVSTDKVLSKAQLAKTLGIKYIGIGMEPLKTGQEVYDYAKRLNEIGQELSDQGLMVTYHNHTQEFAAFDGERIIDVLIKNTDPKFVGFELDAGWCAAAGVDPIAFVEENAGRIKLIHIKESESVVGPQPPFDFSKFTFDENGRPIIPEDMLAQMKKLKEINCPAGKGIVDWKALKAVADEQGCEAYVVEREYTYEGTRPECLRQDLNYYRQV